MLGILISDSGFEAGMHLLFISAGVRTQYTKWPCAFSHVSAEKFFGKYLVFSPFILEQKRKAHYHALSAKPPLIEPIRTYAVDNIQAE